MNCVQDEHEQRKSRMSKLLLVLAGRQAGRQAGPPPTLRSVWNPAITVPSWPCLSRSAPVWHIMRGGKRGRCCSRKEHCFNGA
jgi:hypothetical protein